MNADVGLLQVLHLAESSPAERERLPGFDSEVKQRAAYAQSCRAGPLAGNTAEADDLSVHAAEEAKFFGTSKF